MHAIPGQIQERPVGTLVDLHGHLKTVEGERVDMRHRGMLP
jgi:hypothetical protein